MVRGITPTKKIILGLFMICFASCVSASDSRDSLADKKLQSLDSSYQEQEADEEIEELQQEQQKSLERRITEPFEDQRSL